MKSVLIHVRNNEALNNYKKMIEENNWNEDIKYSREVREMILEYCNNDWKVYLTTIENFFDGIWKEVYSIDDRKSVYMNIEEINNSIDFMIIRNLGSVEGNFKMIANYLDFLIDNYNGITLNNAVAMRKGMTKDYLVEISKEKLNEIGMQIIPTKIYNKEVKYEDLISDYSNLENYLIKPVTGELSNSLKCMKDIDEQFLRYKEDKVGGWVVQPIKKEIWNGEYQLVFVGSEIVYGQKKNYPQTIGANIPSQKERILEKYMPSEREMAIANNVIKYFKNFYNITIDICRIDFMKDSEGNPILIEFEMVNPGFFIGYMEENDESMKYIVKKLRQYCENYN
ncbi:MAG: hypothetical protein HUJ68_00370 [Clostridia bacterium]|nr:hypothetical protein [Clostridia bacterium]